MAPSSQLLPPLLLLLRGRRWLWLSMNFFLFVCLLLLVMLLCTSPDGATVVFVDELIVLNSSWFVVHRASFVDSSALLRSCRCSVPRVDDMLSQHVGKDQMIFPPFEPGRVEELGALAPTDFDIIGAGWREVSGN